MEEKNMRELNMDEMDQVIGGNKVYNIYTQQPVMCNCGSYEWIEHGWGDNPSGYRIECASCHAKSIFDGMHWHIWK